MYNSGGNQDFQSVGGGGGGGALFVGKFTDTKLSSEIPKRLWVYQHTLFCQRCTHPNYPKKHMKFKDEHVKMLIKKIMLLIVWEEHEFHNKLEDQTRIWAWLAV